MDTEEDAIRAYRLRSTRFIDDEMLDDYVNPLISNVRNVKWISSLASSLILTKMNQPIEVIRKSLVGRNSKSLDTYEIVLLPLHAVNHWSLLVYYPAKRSFFHYDTLPGANREKAGMICSCLKRIKLVSDMDLMCYEPDFVPRQNSFWECGYYVLLIARIVILKTPLAPLSRRDVEDNSQLLSIDGCCGLYAELLSMYR